MHKLISIGILFVLGCAATVQTPEAEATTFEVTCEAVEQYVENACEGLTPPIVVKSAIITGHFYNVAGHLRGVHYSGEPYVFVDPFMPEAEQYEVEVHETVHYILHSIGIAQAFGRCYDEEVARRVDADVSGAEYSEDWLELYGCGDDEPDTGMNLPSMSDIKRIVKEHWYADED